MYLPFIFLQVSDETVEKQLSEGLAKEAEIQTAIDDEKTSNEKAQQEADMKITELQKQISDREAVIKTDMLTEDIADLNKTTIKKQEAATEHVKAAKEMEEVQAELTKKSKEGTSLKQQLEQALKEQEQAAEKLKRKQKKIELITTKLNLKPVSQRPRNDVETIPEFKEHEPTPDDDLDRQFDDWVNQGEDEKKKTRMARLEQFKRDKELMEIEEAKANIIKAASVLPQTKPKSTLKDTWGKPEGEKIKEHILDTLHSMKDFSHKAGPTTTTTTSAAPKAKVSTRRTLEEEAELKAKIAQKKDEAKAKVLNPLTDVEIKAKSRSGKFYYQFSFILLSYLFATRKESKQKISTQKKVKFLDQVRNNRTERQMQPGVGGWKRPHAGTSVEVYLPLTVTASKEGQRVVTGSVQPIIAHMPTQKEASVPKRQKTEVHKKPRTYMTPSHTFHPELLKDMQFIDPIILALNKHSRMSKPTKSKK